MKNYTLQGWPRDGLEYLGHCPICGSTSRSLMHNNLQDKVFFCAPGTWTMWRCVDCSSGYLDPRPTIKSIGLAYANYYTHQLSQPVNRPTGNRLKHLIAGLRKRCCPAYLNSYYGHHLKPDLGLLNFLPHMLPERIKLHWQYRIRHLPAPREQNQLLDIGCGNGNFLRVASQLGYTVSGLEIDPAAVQAARNHNFEVTEGSLPDSKLEAGQFDHVTLNHVLEHLHDPSAGLREINRLLKPGGRLWMQFPNIEAFGHKIYGAAWRGLEPPRHLVMPSLGSTKQMLILAGFTEIQLMKPADAAEGYFSQSDVISQHMGIASALDCKMVYAARKAATKYERQHPEHHEQLTLVAYKA